MKYKEGEIIKGTVTGIESYGIFVSFDEFYSGLIHISEISDNYVKNIHDIVKVGETIYVKIIGIDTISNHLILSIKGISYKVKEHQLKKKIKETSLGFKTLKYNLPIWIEKSVKKLEKSSDCTFVNDVKQK